MRLTVNFDGDVYDYLSAYAGGRRLTLSAALNEVLRLAERTPELGSDPSKFETSKHGFLMIAGTGNRLTPERVKEDSEDELPGEHHFVREKVSA